MFHLVTTVLFFSLLLGCTKNLVDQQSADSIDVQKSKHVLVNGPMVGYSTMKEVAVWLQGEPLSTYRLYYQDEAGNQFESESITLGHSKDNTAVLSADKVQPGKLYTYEVKHIDSWSGHSANQSYQTVVGSGSFQSQPLWQWRTDPPEFSFAFGSCNYINEEETDRPGTPYGGEYQIFETIYEQNPDFMIWGGDNTYLREADWNSMTGIWHRYTHSRAVPEMKSLLANVHHYAIWDDHDYGPNDSDRSFYLKDSTLKTFSKFWANPGYGINGKPGITTRFQWNDCEFFLLDNRYYRTPNNRKTGDRYILGEEQFTWLIDNLSSSLASFKFVVIGNQVVSSAAVYENHATFANERIQLLKAIQQEGIKNVVFLSGDRHHSELSVLKEEGKPTIYDITSSPLTAGTHDARDEGNVYQVEGSYIHDRNFANIEISGEWGNRTLHLAYLNTNGEELFQYKINQQN